MIRWKTFHIALLVMLAATVCCLSIAQAKKPTDPPGGGGGGSGNESNDVIYFSYQQDTCQMNPDGSGKTGLGIGYWGSGFEPSSIPHGGSRLFLRSDNGDVTVMKEDGMSYTLLADGDDGSWAAGEDFRWVSDNTGPDAAISWHATDEITGDEAVVRVSLVYNANSGQLEGVDLTSLEHFPGISSAYSWSPDGSMLTFNDQGELYIFDTISGQTMPIGVTQVYLSPQWSPDGFQIAYGIVDNQTRASRIETIALVDGSVTVIANGRLQSPLDGTVVFLPHWSPNSTALVYQFQDVRGYSDDTHIIRANANGKGNHTDLTADLDGSPLGHPRIIGWRFK